ncbi:hypothetical protein AAFP32_00075 [Brevibacterium sp. CBA3109]|uniref:RNA-binding protein n=1 Tax=Brevibacterium koreense TaxID=3140787 RepID=A0AAU7UMY9_9MICO
MCALRILVLEGADAQVESLAEVALQFAVEIARAPAPSPFGLTFTFVDPEGYAVTVRDAS